MLTTATVSTGSSAAMMTVDSAEGQSSENAPSNLKKGKK
jgi:hypothetical protein